MDLPLGYVDNLSNFSSTSDIQHVHKVKFPARLYYPVKDQDFYYGDAVLSQVSEKMSKKGTSKRKVIKS